MFCIAAFIVLVFLGIFSAKYRRLAGDAWKCVSRKVTFRKCDTSFKEDLKSQLLGKLVVKKPRLAKFLDRWLEVLAFIFVVLSIWSLFVVIKSGLNLYVYDTCNPNNAESCSLGAEACSVTTATPGFWSALKNGDAIEWISDEAGQFGETITRIPERMKEWQPREYTTDTSSYYYGFDENKSVALEIIDPGCIYCAKLFGNTKEAGVENRYNLTYIAYAIPDSTTKEGYKFPHSAHIITYLEAIKNHPLETEVAPDWQILERIFTWKAERGQTYQAAINTLYTEAEVDELLQGWLRDIGYSDDQVTQIVEDTTSEELKERLQQKKRVVEDEIKVLKIPTMLIEGRRYNGVVEADKLR